MDKERWWFLETKGLDEIQIEKGGVCLISYIGGKSILFSHQQDFMNALDAMLEYSKKFGNKDLDKENEELKEALKRIDFFVTQVLSSSGLQDPKHTLMTTSKLIHDTIEKVMYGKKDIKIEEPKNKVVHNYQITIKIMEDQSSQIIVEPLHKEENKNDELEKRIIYHYQSGKSKFFLCGRGVLDGWGPEDQCATHIEHTNCKECLEEWIKLKLQS